MGQSLRGFVGLVLVLGVLTVPPVSAQEGGGDAVLLILDASGSMNRVDDNGVVLIEGAQEALTRLVGVLPPGAQVGLRVYGHRVPNTDKANGCRDTELIVPVGPLDPSTMTDAINSFGAKGFTPIGLSLQEAANDLGGRHGTIVLVSDGEDTCGTPDPCQVARELAVRGIDVSVHAVGFFLGNDDAARAQLQCIADETGGTFREVTSIEPLAAELGSLVMRALPSVGRLQLPIQGALDVALAPMLPLVRPFEEGTAGSYFAEGSYVSSLLPGETNWFAVELTEGQGFVVYGGGGELVPDPLPGEAIEITILDEQLNDARREAPRFGPNRVEATDFGPDQGFAASTFTDFPPWEEFQPTEQRNARYQGYDEDSYNAAALRVRLAPREKVPPAGTYYVGITWQSNRPPVETGVGWGLDVWERPPRSGSEYVLANGSTDSATATLVDAPLFDVYPLSPGEYPARRGFYVGEINSGETRWYRHTVEWDEAVGVEATLVRPPNMRDKEDQFVVGIYDPALAAIGTDYFSAMEATIDDSSADLGVGATMAYTGEGKVPPAIEGVVYIAVTWTSPRQESSEVRLIVDVMDRYPEGVNPPTGAAIAPITAEVTDPSGAVAKAEEDAGRSLLIVTVVGAAILAGTGIMVLRSRRSRRSSS